jgi:hypothetical protein
VNIPNSTSPDKVWGLRSGVETPNQQQPEPKTNKEPKTETKKEPDQEKNGETETSQEPESNN